MPTVTLRDYETQYRGRSSSKRYNDAISRIQDDLITCLEELQKLQSKFLTQQMATNYQNQAVASKTDQLLAEASGCLEYYIAGGTDKLAAVSMYDVDAVIAGAAAHNPLYGQLTLPSSHSNSKIPVLETPGGNIEAVPGVTIDLWEGLSGTYETKDRTHQIYKAVDHNYSTFWVNEYDVSPTRLMFRLTYPTAVNPSVNVVTVNPFPETVVDITDIQYNGLTTTDTIPGFVSTSERKIYHFEAVDVNDQITIRMETTTTMLNLNGDSVFPYGFQIVDLGFIDFLTTAYGVVRLNASDPGFSTLTSFDADVAINTIDSSTITDHVRFQIYNDMQADWDNPSAIALVYDSDTDTYPYSSDLPSIDTESGGPVESLYVKVTLNKVVNTTPVIRGMTITYTDGT
jgi:hypothetical protein